MRKLYHNFFKSRIFDRAKSASFCFFTLDFGISLILKSGHFVTLPLAVLYSEVFAMKVLFLEILYYSTAVVTRGDPPQTGHVAAGW